MKEKYLLVKNLLEEDKLLYEGKIFAFGKLPWLEKLP